MTLRLRTIARRGWPAAAGLCTIAVGMLLTAIYAGTAVCSAVSSRRALREFDQTHRFVGLDYRKTQASSPTDQDIDFSLWSNGRIAAYRDDLATKRGWPLAVLRFERLKLRVPVFEGTDDWTLNRGAGWIPGTARPGEVGNIGIAGHRDSFFRVLKDIRSGDAMELIWAARTATYTVSQVEIVNPSDVSVLQSRREPSLTLVTCYPFYFVGAAPRRFIVHAALRKQGGIEEFANQSSATVSRSVNDSTW
jgi:sortase A